MSWLSKSVGVALCLAACAAFTLTATAGDPLKGDGKPAAPVKHTTKNTRHTKPTKNTKPARHGKTTAGKQHGKKATGRATHKHHARKTGAKPPKNTKNTKNTRPARHTHPHPRPHRPAK